MPSTQTFVSQSESRAQVFAIQTPRAQWESLGHGPAAHNCGSQRELLLQTCRYGHGLLALHPGTQWVLPLHEHAIGSQMLPGLQFMSLEQSLGDGLHTPQPAGVPWGSQLSLVVQSLCCEQHCGEGQPRIGQVERGSRTPRHARNEATQPQPEQKSATQSLRCRQSVTPSALQATPASAEPPSL